MPCWTWKVAYLKHHYSDMLVHSHHHDSHQHKIDATHICVVLALATTNLIPGSIFWPCNSSTPALLRGKLYNLTPESSDYDIIFCRTSLSTLTQDFNGGVVPCSRTNWQAIALPVLDEMVQSIHTYIFNSITGQNEILNYWTTLCCWKQHNCWVITQQEYGADDLSMLE